MPVISQPAHDWSICWDPADTKVNVNQYEQREMVSRASHLVRHLTQRPPNMSPSIIIDPSIMNTVAPKLGSTSRI
jgi:hypothetical protein